MTGDMTLKKVSDRILTFQEQIEFFTLQRNDVAKKFSVSRLCLAAIGLIKPVKTLDPTGNTERELIGMIKSSYQKIKGVKSVPLKFRGYIKFFLLMYRK